MLRTSATPAVIVGGIGSTVTLARSLGRIGVPVHVLGGGPPTLAGASRYCRSVTHVGTVEGVVDRWLAWLEADGPRGAVLLPAGDDAVELLAGHRERLEDAGYRLPPTSGETSLAMLDKARTYDLARRVGTPTPQTWTVSGREDVEDIRAQLRFPVALKPLHSHLFSKHFPGLKLFVAQDEGELVASLDATSRHDLQMLVTEIVPGPEHHTWTYSTFTNAAGRPLYELTRNKLRSQPVHFGTNCYVVTRRNAEVQRLGRTFLDGVGLRGLANVEFKWDADAGTYKLIECNHRFVNAQEVIRRAGVDVALLAYHDALGESSGSMPAWREGVRLWWPERDAKAALQYRREGQLTLATWVRSILHTSTYVPIFAFDDPGPSMLRAVRRVRSAAERLRS